MNGKKRILLIGPLPPPIGGDTVSTYNLLHSPYWKEAGYLLQTVNVTGENRLKLPEDRLTPAHLLRGLRIFCQTARRLPGCDIVLLWANARFIYTAGVPLIFLCRLFRRPVIVKPFGTYLVQRFPALGKMHKKIIRSLLMKCERILPQTIALREAFLEQLVLPGKLVSWFPNFLTDDTFAGTSPPGEYSGRCVFVGQIKMEKGIFDIITALEKETGLSCDFYGPVHRRDEKTFFQMLSVRDNLNYRGVLKPAEVSSKIASYDIFLFPTYHAGEGYPAAILQAFAMGVPVVASRWTSVPDLVEDGSRGLLVDIKSPAALREAVKRLGSDPALYRRIVENARQFARQFSEEAVVRDLLIRDIIEKI